MHATTFVPTEDRDDNLACPRCGERAQGDGVPVTTGGWHADVCYGWGRYAGVHLCRATAARCPACGVEWSCHPDWD